MEKPNPKPPIAAAALAALLVAFRLYLLALGKVDEATRKVLLVPLAELFKMIIPHVHKLDEFIYASKNGMKVESALHGADMKDKDGNRWELKVSILGAATSRCNFNWTVPRADTPERRREKLLENVREKTEGGGAILRITDSLGNLIEEFKFTHAFLMAYFARVPFGVAATHNMGTQRCKHCKRFHRLERMHAAQFDFENFPDQVSWAALFAKDATKCPAAV